MNIDWTAVTLAVIAASPGVIALYRGARKDRADAADIITQAAERAVDVIRSQLDAACKEIERLTNKYIALEKDHNALKNAHGKLKTDHDKLYEEFDVVIAGAHVLRDQVVELQGTPRYTPPERRSRKGKSYD